MATLVAQTDFSQARQVGVSTYTIPLTQATTAGSKLVLLAWGGATVTAKITDNSGAAFNLRSQALGAQAVSVSDFTSVGGETAVFITLNGPENIAVTIFELTNIGAFISATNNGTGVTANAANDFQAKATSSVSLGANANGVLVGGWSVGTLAAFGQFNRWRQMGPRGQLLVNGGMQPGSFTQFIYAGGIADVTNTDRFPVDLASAGDYRATSTFLTGGVCFAVSALYADTSGLPTVSAAANAIAAENSLPGTHSSNWYLGTTGTNSTIAGYTDKTSYLPSETVNFKVDSTNNAFRVEIYRLGYYGWDTLSARLVTAYITGTPTVQSAPTVDGTLGSVSCAWTTNATWTIPSNMPPGVYYTLFRRTDAPSNVASGHFVIRSASAQGKMAVCLPDYTYQAYNIWGATTDNGGTISSGTWTGRSLYAYGADGTDNAAHRAYAVSFDRPWGTQSMQSNTYMFDSEQGSWSFLEAQGYDMTYYTNGDLENNPTLLNTAALVVMSGHQEYWTQNVYDCFSNAVAAGVNMLVNSSNTALWHTRFAAGDTNKRTMICYKDSYTADVTAGFTGTGYDPVSYTGTWRDTRTNPGTVNNTDIRRENALTGQLFRFSAPVAVAATVPFAQKTLPIWRNSASVQALSSGQSYTTTGFGIFGDEVDIPDGSSGQPANLVMLCPTTTGTINTGANTAGTVYNTSTSLTASFTLHRHNSGALIFNTGSWRGFLSVARWRNTGFTGAQPDANWQNALLAIIYDLGMIPVAAREMQQVTDTALTNPATGAVTGGRSAVAIAYGLRAPADGNSNPIFS